jgi:hypothetical protein
MSRVNMVPMAMNWASSEIAASTPAATRPDTTGEVSLPTINPSTAFDPVPGGTTGVSVPGSNAPVAQNPIRMQGSQASRIETGWATSRTL